MTLVSILRLPSMQMYPLCAASGHLVRWKKKNTKESREAPTERCRNQSDVTVMLHLLSDTPKAPSTHLFNATVSVGIANMLFAILLNNGPRFVSTATKVSSDLFWLATVIRVNFDAGFASLYS